MVLGIAACLFPILWFRPGDVIDVADYNLPLGAGRAISHASAGWDMDNLGVSTYRQTPLLFPYLAFWRAGEALGLTSGHTETAWFILLHLLAYLSALFLIGHVTRRSLHAFGPAEVVAALAYVYNPFTLVSWSVGHNIAFTAYAVAPLWLALFVRALRREHPLRHAVALSIVSLLFASADNNAAIVVTLIFLPSCVAIFLTLVVRASAPRRVLRNTTVVGLWVALMNAWWMVPALAYARSGLKYESSPGAALSVLDWPNLSTSIPFFEFLRGMGYWGQYTGYQEVPNFNWAVTMQSPVAIVASIALVASAFVPLALIRRPNIWALLAPCLALIGISFAKALNGPLGVINRLLYLEVPGFIIFRSAYEKFAGLIFLGVLIGLGAALAVMTRGRSREMVAAALALGVFISAWPLFTGAVAESRSDGVSWNVRIPNYYYALRQWSSQLPPGGSILVLPQLGAITTTWGYSGAADPLYNFSALPVITGETEASPLDGPRLAAVAYTRASFDRPPLMRRLGVRYILVRRDAVIRPPGDALMPYTIEERLIRAKYPLVVRLGLFAVYGVPGTTTSSLTANAQIVVPSNLTASALHRIALATDIPIADEGTTVAGGRLGVCAAAPTAFLDALQTIVATCRAGGSAVRQEPGVVSPPIGTQASLLPSVPVQLGRWSGLNPITAGAAGNLSVERAYRQAGGGDVLTVSASRGMEAVTAPVEDFQPGDYYGIAFDYQHVTGGRPQFALWQFGVGSIALSSQSLSTRPGWHHYAGVIEADSLATGLALFVYASAPESGGVTSNMYASFRIQRSSPPPLLVSGGALGGRSVLPVTSEHQVGMSFSGTVESIKGGAWVVLATTFDPGWTMAVRSLTGGTAKVLAHVRVNGYANAWRIEGAGSVAFTVRYGSWWRTYGGYPVSMLAFLAGVLVLISRRAILGARRTGGRESAATDAAPVGPGMAAVHQGVPHIHPEGGAVGDDR